MAWNEPGGGNKDPWSGKGDKQGPPDLDEVVKKMQDKLGGLFGGKRGSSGGGGSSGSPIPGPGSPGFKGVAAIVGVIFLLLLVYKSFYTVAPAERGVVMQFGAYKDITQPGPHFMIPFVQDVVKVNVDQISSFRHGATMLTRDENIVDFELTVQARIQDAADYLFQDQNPEKTLRDATETAVRETIGKSDLDYILTEGRSAVGAQIRKSIQDTVNLYKTGLEVTSVNTQPAKPPEAVKGAFDDAIKAREDKEKLENQAEAYANEIVPKARGGAARRMEDAKAYKFRVIAQAEGETSRFLAVLKEYERAPEVTRNRLYLETVENVLANTTKVMMDAKDSNSLMYLPLDKLIESQPGASARGYTAQSQTGTRPQETRPREDTRSRRTR